MGACLMRGIAHRCVIKRPPESEHGAAPCHSTMAPPWDTNPGMSRALPTAQVLFSGSIRSNVDPFGLSGGEEILRVLEMCCLQVWVRVKVRMGSRQLSQREIGRKHFEGGSEWS